MSKVFQWLCDVNFERELQGWTSEKCISSLLNLFFYDFCVFRMITYPIRKRRNKKATHRPPTQPALKFLNIRSPLTDPHPIYALYAPSPSPHRTRRDSGWHLNPTKTTRSPRTPNPTNNLGPHCHPHLRLCTFLPSPSSPLPPSPLPVDKPTFTTTPSNPLLPTTTPPQLPIHPNFCKSRRKVETHSKPPPHKPSPLNPCSFSWELPS